MKILKRIFDYLKTPKGQRNILIVAIILIVIFFRSCGGSASDQEVVMYKQNLEALKDSVRNYRTENGELVQEKMALITKADDLGDYNKELADEVQKLKDNPIVITKVRTVMVHDTVWITPTIDSANVTFNSDSTARIVPFTWKYDTTYADGNYKSMAGRYIIEVDTAMNVESRSFAVTRDSVGLTFTTGITENEDGLLEIFVKSPYPGFDATAIDGALIDPRESDVIKKFFPPKRWSIGPYVGYGVYLNPQKLEVGHGINAGVSVQYGLFQWGKK